jgi:hypothetical protein
MQIRSPKSEIRIPKPHSSLGASPPRFSDFGFRRCFGFRISDLGFGSLALLLAALSLQAATRREPPAVAPGPDGRLVYVADTQGNQVPDFSCCGYAGANRPIPTAPVRVVVAPVDGDATARIQKAIDYVSSLPTETNGLRGAVLLLKGRHKVFGSLQLRGSGIVLRGQGMGADGTVLFAAGPDRRTLIRILGANDRLNSANKFWEILDDYVPVGAKSFHLGNATELRPGDTINMERPSTQAWINRLVMTEFGGGIGDWRLVWKPGSRDLIWDRIVNTVEGNLVTVDAPITTAIEKEFGGGRVEPYTWPGRLQNVGVENLRCESAFDAGNLKDENHAWCAITMENAQDAWVRQVTGEHFAGSMVAIYESCKQVTVEDCLSLAPVSEEGGYRRHTFFTMGQMTLFLRCHAEHGWHDFSAGHCAAGPNAFVQCDAALPLRDSGPIESWAAGVLYDGVTIDGNGLSLASRGAGPNGAGWSAANCVLWQCSAAFIRCANPPTARNWALGCWGEFEGDGIWQHSNESVKPESLYVAQLADRLGGQTAARVKLLRRSTEERSNPTLAQAAQLIAAARQPAPQLAQYIVSAPSRNPIPCEPGNAKRVEDVGVTDGDQSKIQNQESKIGQSLLQPAGTTTLTITNGWLVCGGQLLIGGKTNVAWWRGNIRPGDAPSFEPCLARFVPGRSGPGFTDDLKQLADELSGRGIAALEHHYGLWYERRRDDHERVRRVDAEVWPPFYEMPFARTGQGAAWNGLSRYDLTKYNPWYWSRLKEFAGLCDQRGLVLFHENYFQHNILEAGAHWADFAWRPANNVNDTGFPEPPPYAGDKRIFMAEQFYDVTHPVRRQLHRDYIRQCLESFATNSNVIQFTSAEFTGPLAFVQFWLDTISEWEGETGHKPLVALSCTKDVQDAVLADPIRSALVDVVDFRYWWQTSKGLFAPAGGKNLAPRQFERQWKGGRPTDVDLAGMVAEYRQRQPGKAVICDFESAGWAFLCAGGSLPRLPRTTEPRLLASILRLQPWPGACGAGRWVLRGPGEYLVYLGREAEPGLDLSQENSPLVAKRVELKTGAVTVVSRSLVAGRETRLPKSPNTAEVLWLTKE